MGEVIERTGELIRDPEAWSDAFDEVPVEDRLDFLVETFKYPLDDEFLQAVDMGGILIDLEPAVLPQPFADLVRTIRDRAPALHGREIPYLEGSVLAWELFCREGHRLEKTCQYLLQVAATHPSWFLRAFRWLKFYGEITLGEALAKQAFEWMHSAVDLIGEPERELADFLLIHHAQSVYRAVREKREPDLASMQALEEQVYGGTSHYLAEGILDYWGGSAAPDPVDWNVPSERDAAFAKISWSFVADVYDRFDIPFVIGFAIIDGFLGMLRRRSSFEPENFFLLTEEMTSSSGEALLEPFDRDAAITAATIWGIPYVAEFLVGSGWIDETTETSLLEVTRTLQAGFMRQNAANLWRYDFVHRWRSADNMDPQSATEEACQFERSAFDVGLRKEYMQEIEKMSWFQKQWFEEITRRSRGTKARDEAALSLGRGENRPSQAQRALRPKKNSKKKVKPRKKHKR